MCRSQVDLPVPRGPNKKQLRAGSSKKPTYDFHNAPQNGKTDSKLSAEEAIKSNRTTLATLATLPFPAAAVAATRRGSTIRSRLR